MFYNEQISKVHVNYLKTFDFIKLFNIFSLSFAFYCKSYNSMQSKNFALIVALISLHTHMKIFVVLSSYVQIPMVQYGIQEEETGEVVPPHNATKELFPYPITVLFVLLFIPGLLKLFYIATPFKLRKF